MKPGPKPKPRPEPVAVVTKRTAYSTRYRIDNVHNSRGLVSYFATVYASGAPMRIDHEHSTRLMAEHHQAEIRPIAEKAIKNVQV